MSVIISGSVAYDTVYSHDGHFFEHIKPEALEKLNLTFQAQSMRKTLGGCAGNIAYSLKQLGGDPLIWGAVGDDSDPFLRHFEKHGIRTDGITRLENTWTASCSITTDCTGNQLTTFLSGAMERADTLPFPPVPVTCGILAPTMRHVLMAHASAYRAANIPFLFDPGQTTPLFSETDFLSLFDSAAAVAFSDYEAEMVQGVTGLTPKAISERSPAVYCTHGAAGSSVWIQGEEFEIIAPPLDAVDPVGAGDAYRGGLLWGMERGLDPVTCARIGTVMGRAKVRVTGPAYRMDEAGMRREYEALWEPPAF